MSKKHLQSVAEQITKTGHGSAPFHYEKMPVQASEPMKAEDIQTKATVDENSIRLRAYQIHQEKGGSSLNNWLEAEASLKSTDRAVSRFINEGDPNIQK